MTIFKDKQLRKDVEFLWEKFKEVQNSLEGYDWESPEEVEMGEWFQVRKQPRINRIKRLERNLSALLDHLGVELKIEHSPATTKTVVKEKKNKERKRERRFRSNA